LRRQLGPEGEEEGVRVECELAQQLSSPLGPHPRPVTRGRCCRLPFQLWRRKGEMRCCSRWTLASHPGHGHRLRRHRQDDEGVDCSSGGVNTRCPSICDFLRRSCTRGASRKDCDRSRSEWCSNSCRCRAAWVDDSSSELQPRLLAESFSALPTWS